jgi:hypothetical protein
MLEAETGTRGDLEAFYAHFSDSSMERIRRHDVKSEPMARCNVRRCAFCEAPPLQFRQGDATLTMCPPG